MAKKKQVVLVKHLGVETSKPIRFVQALERLCRGYAGKDYHFKFSVE